MTPAEPTRIEPRVLLVEDQPGDARLAMIALRGLSPSMPAVTHVTTLAEAIAALAGASYDLVLTDLGLPDSDGLGTCRAIIEHAGGSPVVVLTGSHEEPLGLEAIHIGAQDYLIKGAFQIAEFRRVLHHARERQRLVVAVADAKRGTDEALSRLRSLESMRDQLTHMLVHDLRSPMFGIRLYLEAFLRDAGQAFPADLVDDVAKAHDLTGGLVEMVSSILDVHRIEAGQMPLVMERCGMRALIDEAVEQIAGRVRGSAIRIDGASPTLLCDPRLIRRTIANLVGNALRFSPPDRPVSIACAVVDGWVEVAVGDEGKGIPVASQERIFEKFGSLEAGPYSTGLGLPFCKIVVELHGGAIGVRSVEGQGSTFWFRLPR